MRILTMSMIMTCVACVQAAPRASQPNAEPFVIETDAMPTALQAASSAQPSAPDPITPEDLALIMTPSLTAGGMDVASMKDEVQATFAQSKLSAEQNAVLSDQAMALIAAASARDHVTTERLGNELVKQALGSQGLVPSFGSLMVASIMASVMDLIAAAGDSDPAAVMNALKDLVAAFEP